MKQAIRHAAQYVRMSTELQQYSIVNQTSLIAEYAEDHHIKIVKTYIDEGKTGLKIKGRKGLQQLLADVVSNEAPFEIILVYDISRWGRFQDNDESAYYEFICRRAGKQVIYCAENFSNDGSPLANVIKGLKRSMASEYSRELSEKVFRGQSKLASLGWHVGARSPYGMRRMMVSQTGKQRGTMNFGERKSLQSDRVILVPGPPEEVSIVRQIFQWFTSEKIYYQSIADRLNDMQVAPPTNTDCWTKGIIKNLLRNPKYLGTMVYNRTSERLSTRKRQNPRSEWVTKEAAFSAIIDRRTFDQTQIRIESNIRVYPDEYLEESLRRALAQHGRLSISALKATKGSPSAMAYRRRYGTMENAYLKIGYSAQLDPRPTHRKKHDTLTRTIAIVTKTKELLRNHGMWAASINKTTIVVNNRLVLRVSTFLHNKKLNGYQLFLNESADWTLAILPSDNPNEANSQFYLISNKASSKSSIYLNKKRTLSWLDQYIISWEVLPEAITLALASIPLD